MAETFWTYFFVTLTFAVYVFIALKSKASSTQDFYVASHDVHPVVNGMATAADWMSAASFLSMAGLIAFLGYGGSVYLMGDRWVCFISTFACAISQGVWQIYCPRFWGHRTIQTSQDSSCYMLNSISFTYIAGQMKGVGVVFSGFLGVPSNYGILIGMIIVFFYAVLGGMKGITYTQVAQYCVLIFAYTVPAIFISIVVTGSPIPQIGFVSNIEGSDTAMLQRLNDVLINLGFIEYTKTNKSMFDTFCITAALMFGTAGLPHVIIRFFTVKSSQDARLSAGWALFFIAILYTTAPAVGAFARLNFVDTVNEAAYINSDQNQKEIIITSEESNKNIKKVPNWFINWEKAGYLSFEDKNNDNQMQYRGSNPPDGVANEIIVNRDIFVLANPEISGLPNWVVGLGGIWSCRSSINSWGF